MSMDFIGIVISSITLGSVLVLALMGRTRVHAVEDRQSRQAKAKLQWDADYKDLVKDLRTALERIRVLESARTKIQKDIDLVVERVRTVEKDRTGLFKDLEAAIKRIRVLEGARTKIQKDIDLVVERVRTVEKDRTHLIRALQALSADFDHMKTLVKHLDSPHNRPDMPSGQKPELSLSGALDSIDINSEG